MGEGCILTGEVRDPSRDSGKGEPQGFDVHGRSVAEGTLSLAAPTLPDPLGGVRLPCGGLDEHLPGGGVIPQKMFSS